LGRVQFWIVTLLALLGLVATGANVAVVMGNRTAQAEVAQRQQFVQQSLQLEQLYRDIVRALAELGARNNDEQLRGLLAKHGISFSVNAPAAAGAAPGAPAAPRK
jgi:hypothetical protein